MKTTLKDMAKNNDEPHDIFKKACETLNKTQQIKFIDSACDLVGGYGRDYFKDLMQYGTAIWVCARDVSAKSAEKRFYFEKAMEQFDIPKPKGFDGEPTVDEIIANTKKKLIKILLEIETEPQKGCAKHNEQRHSIINQTQIRPADSA